MIDNKDKDNVFFVLFFISFVVLTTEIVINSLVIDNYKFSFFFWLEIIATISIIPDIDWLMSPIQKLLGMTPSNEAVDLTIKNSGGKNTVTESLYSALGSFKFFKLLRIVKLYKYCLSATVGDDDEDGENEEGEGAKKISSQQAAIKNELNPNELGKTFSDTTTRRILIGVVLMYIAYPFLTNNTSVETFEAGLKQLFLFGSSKCQNSNPNGPDNQLCGDKFIHPDGWNTLLKIFVDLGKYEGTTYYEVVGFYAPDYNDDGKIKRISVIYDNPETEDIFWKEDSPCAGRKVSNEKDCRLRTEEMTLVVYTPENCENEDIKGCNELNSFVRLSIKSQVTRQALYKLLMIAFTTILLFISAISVGNDTTAIVVKPISKIVTAIRKFTASPLERPELMKKKIKQNTTGPDLKKQGWASRNGKKYVLF